MCISIEGADTRMLPSGPKAPRTADQGAEVLVWLATLSAEEAKGKQGKFFVDNAEKSYVTGN